MNSYGPAEVLATKIMGRGVFARKRILQGEGILPFVGRLVFPWEVRNANAALQLDENLFVESDGTIDEYLNHSCSPNCRIDFQQLALVTLRDIDRGEELTFDYNTSEYDLVEQGCSFTCLCGSGNCIHEVKGFRYLPAGHKEEIVPYLSPFLRRKWEEETKGIVEAGGLTKTIDFWQDWT